MDILGSLFGWLWWAAQLLLGLLWLLVGGWVSTLLQIVVLALGFFVWRHGWRQAPAELWRQTRALYRLSRGAIRASEAMERARAPEPGRSAVAPVVTPQSPRQFGDVTINMSSALSGLMFLGLAAAAWFRV